MCTAISYKTNNHYFGRNLDWEFSFGEKIVITPRKYPFHFGAEAPLSAHYAIIGMALVENDYPLYFDATNEFGLSMAGLNFPGNAFYHEPKEDTLNIASYELIPWILCRCKTVDEAIEELKTISITNQAFSKEFPPTPLHWIVADRHKSITVEATVSGLHIHKNPWGVLTNNPPFEYHLHNMCNYLNLSASEPINKFAGKLPVRPYSRGMSAIGLPGDFSSASRFVRAAFIKWNSISAPAEEDSVTQFFHILSLAEQPAGCVRSENGNEKTIYTSCCNTDEGIYYYTTYENRRITAISLHDVDLDSNVLAAHPLIRTQSINIGKIQQII